MHLYLLIISLLLLLLLLLLQPIYGDHIYIYHSCTRPTTFTPNDNYEANLKNLTNNLIFQTPPTGFSFSSVGQGEDQIYGLALCRNDETPTVCAACLFNASAEISWRCPYKKSAVFWYERCLLKYSNKPFFEQIDYGNWYIIPVRVNKSDPEAFSGKAVELLRRLAGEASFNQEHYAKGKIEVGNGKEIFGMVQCTRDLWNVDCSKCLNESIALLPNC